MHLNVVNVTASSAAERIPFSLKILIIRIENLILPSLLKKIPYHLKVSNRFALGKPEGIMFTGLIKLVLNHIASLSSTECFHFESLHHPKFALYFLDIKSKEK